MMPIRKIDMEEVNFSDIIMNSNSPRLSKSLKHSTTEELIPYFLFNESLDSLIGSLSTLGWFPTEPIMIQKMYNSTYTVIDGNRRVAACWLLLHPDHILCPDYITKIANEMHPDKIKKLKRLTAFVQE